MVYSYQLAHARLRCVETCVCTTRCVCVCVSLCTHARTHSRTLTRIFDRELILDHGCVCTFTIVAYRESLEACQTFRNPRCSHRGSKHSLLTVRAKRSRREGKEFSSILGWWTQLRSCLRFSTVYSCTCLTMYIRVRSQTHTHIDMHAIVRDLSLANEPRRFLNSKEPGHLRPRISSRSSACLLIFASGSCLRFLRDPISTRKKRISFTGHVGTPPDATVDVVISSNVHPDENECSLPTKNTGIHPRKLHVLRATVSY